MSWSSVPYVVGGGAEHDPEVFRLLSHVAFNANEGVVRSGDLKVRETTVPGSQVEVRQGSCSIRNRASGVVDEMYAGKNVGTDTVTIAPTDSSGGRSDLVVVRVEDPQYPGWPTPPDVTSGPYIFTRVISDVPPTTTRLQDVAGHENDSGVALARIDLPVSTGTVTDSLITDLRRLANPQTHRELLTWTPAGDNLTSETFVNWPGAADWQVFIPEWATHVAVKADFYGIVIDEGNVFGHLRVDVGGQHTESTKYNRAPEGLGKVDSFSFGVADTIFVPQAIRGTTVTVQTEGKRGGGTTFVRLEATDTSSLSVDLQFRQRAI